uniref:Homeobox domain-containing protein n=1 Tax=Heterorhabditis bacteriophora TaxID=37862 RepID=A0A1I7XEI3_HETBA
MLFYSSSSANNFSFRCPQCAMAFRNESSLQSHSILHLFSTSQKCPTCSTMCSTNEELKSHIETEHPKEEESRCELCQEAFSSKTALVAHFNSVRHLHKAKKQLEQQGSVDLSAQSIRNFISTLHSSEFLLLFCLRLAAILLVLEIGTPLLCPQFPIVLAVLNPSSPSDKKPFRCNICKIGYGQGATLDIHLRSVAHQSRMSKIADLVANGDIDASKPVLEQPGGPAQRIIRDLMDRDDEASFEVDHTIIMLAPINGNEANEPVSAQQQNVMTMFNIMNMLMGQNQGMPMSFSTAKTISGEGTPDNEDDISSPKNAIAFAAMLKAFGNEKVIFLAPGLSDKISRISEIADEKIETISRVNCTECGEDQSSILALSFHVEELHSGVIPENTLRSFAERLLFAICELDDTPQGPSSNGHESPTTSRTASRDDSEPPEKRPRSETSPLDAPKPDLAQMAMLSMMGGFPFMPPNPLGGFMPSMGDFFNPMMAQHMQLASSPAKRARTRITDEQLKILRQYFDINNSPSENQIKEMSLKAGLPEKVIKHWFRNTLFKERQRDKDSPYNFNVPPQMGIDLDTYEKTGETKVVPLATDVCHLLISFPHLYVDLKIYHIYLVGSLSQLPQSGASSGRRANRTRFTDYQLRTLQQFFDKQISQAYPKDDDLEILSKKLQLSPRVIVVWFQNARQKARKIYENQPNHESNDRFVRTPGCNFQCKRCNLVFQRYYELIQHQQKKCYKDDGLAQANDNKGVEESLTEDEKAQLAQQATLATIAETKPADLLKLLGTSKSSTEALLKMCESAGASSSPSSSSGGFHKRCPFCGLLFRNKLSLTEHIPSRHPQQHAITLVDVDLLPNAEDVPVLIPPAILENREIAGVLDLSNSTQDRESLSMSPFLGQSDGDDGTEYIDDVSFPSFIGGPSTPHQAGGGRSPANNKRYRTHLTPTQVHVMKCVFADYKTPSMTECEFLGREIGLHKRVVQVWFQNARGQLRSDDTHAEPTSYPVENGNDIKTIARTAIKSKGLCPSQLNITNLNGFPFNFINGMLPGSIVKFTQDGETVEDLRAKLSGDDARCLSAKEIEVGWACPSCTNVFQQEPLLKNHQRTVCQGTDTIHYECSTCSIRLGTQKEFCAHCESAEHQLVIRSTSSSAQ